MEAVLHAQIRAMSRDCVVSIYQANMSTAILLRDQLILLWFSQTVAVGFVRMEAHST